MDFNLPLEMANQPDDVTCGPTCLQAVYRYYGDDPPITQLIEEVRMLKEGGTMAVFLANHALRNGYRATIYTYNLQLFDPTWFDESVSLHEKLAEQARYKLTPKLQVATRGYQEFLSLGGELRFHDLTPQLIRDYLQRDIPILTGLSSTYLYHATREIPETNRDDDIRGEVCGHFVVCCGYHHESGDVLIADPWAEHPFGEQPKYAVSMERLLGAILLGVITYDANLLIIEPELKDAA